MHDNDPAGDPTQLLAVVGMAGRFPNAPDLDAFWQLLADGGDAIRPVPPERWDATAQLDPERAVQDVGGFLDGVDQFDPGFFGISPREAADIDPQQRLMLEVAWRALEDAGQPAAALRGTRTGVYVGASWHDYEILRKERGAGATQHSTVGNALDVIAARVSYFLGATGPSLVVETGCSSSLVALHLAGQALRTGDIDAALVGGVNLILAPDVSIGLTHFGGLSPEGRCKAFAADADGFVRAEGIAGLYLKRLDRAIADGDRIQGVIVRTVVNNDGGGDSLVTPNPAGQEDLLRRAYTEGGIPLDRLAYVEAHGTGTGRGDPVEAEALGRIVGQARNASAGPLPIGSVKTNIGHTEATAGLAGLLKVLLAIRHRTVPATRHRGELNPAIDFTGLNLRVATGPVALPDEPLFLGVNSFGWGGTNAHVVVAGPPRDPAGAEPASPALGVPAVLPISAHSPAALRDRVRDVHGLLAHGADPVQVAGALAHRADHFPLRVAALAVDTAATLERLDAWAADADADVDGLVTGRAETVGRVAFVFPGQGSQWAAMGRDLYAASPIFQSVVDRCSRAIAPHVDWDLAEVLSGAAGSAWTSRVDMVQPALWAMSVGLAELWRHAGVTPDVVVGHSQGEVSAATVAGILSYEDAALVVATRSALAVRASGRGRMLAVALDPESARAALAGFEDLVSLAVENGPDSCVLSGDGDAVLALREILEADGVHCRLVDVDYASHSPQMDALTPALTAALGAITPTGGTVELVSTVRAAIMSGPELDAAYWAENLRRPVRFLTTVDELIDRGVTHLVEISPHPVLLTALEQIAVRRPAPPRVLTTLRRDAGTVDDLAGAFAAAYVAGLAPHAYLPPGRTVRLPGVAWQRTRNWTEGARRRTGRLGLDVALVPSATEPDLWQGDLELGIGSQPWLADHQVHDAVVVPGAAMLAIALATGRARTGQEPAVLRDVRFTADLTLAGDAAAQIGALWRDDLAEGGSFTLCSLSSDGSGWTTHATARAQQSAGTTPVPFPTGLAAQSPIEAVEFYEACGRRGLRYGPALQGVRRVSVDGARALGELELPAKCRAGATAALHPALWDAALQVSLAVGEGTATVVPTEVERVERHAGTALTAGWSYAERRDDGRYDVHVFDTERQPVLSMIGLRLRELTLTAGDDLDVALLHRLAFRPAQCPEPAELTGRWLVAGTGPLAVALPGEELTDLAALAVAEPAGVVFLVPTAEPEQRAALVRLTELARAAAALPAPPRIAVVTTGAQAVTEVDLPDPGAALFWGFTRVLRREHPELAPTLIDVGATGEPAAVALAVAAELATTGGDDQVVLRGADRWVGRIVAGRAEPDEAAPEWRTPAQPFRLVPARPGRWDGLEFRPRSRRAPADGEVELEVTAAALNFIDVMKAMGTYPDPVGGELLGGECAGRITAVGAGVTGLAVGDRVVACAFGSIASHLTVDAGRVRPLPPEIDDADAAALPLATLTAWYALADLGRVRAGETVLVHSAAGGLGLAAIGVAQYLGAEVLATAGTAEKRDYLRGIGVRHVFDSRDLSWADEVLTATGGRGVDVVLNSLTGAAIDAGLDVLAEDGRFLEVGKKDVYAGRRISLAAFRKSVTISAVDLAGLMDRRPERFDPLLTEVWDLVTTGKLPRLPVTRYDFVGAADALRTMATGRHIGKLVLVDPATVTAVAPEPMPGGRFRADGSYVITGGLGALGLSLAEFVAGHGGGSLALLGRRAPDQAAADRIAALRAAGCDVRAYSVDVTSREALAGVLDQVRVGQAPIRGVVHAAGVLDDATVATLRPEQIEHAVAPKADGARHLDALTAGDPLDLFVLFSSAAALVGNAGQAGYAAGNAYLDSLAEARRRRGRPALSVQWGPFADVGLAAQDGNRGDRLSERGMGSFPVAQAWPALARFLRDGERVVGYVPLNVRQWFDAYPDTAALPSWQELRAEGGAAGGADSKVFLDRLHGAAPDDRVPLVEDKVRELTGRVLRIDPGAVDQQTPFKALGLDSLMSLELRNRLESAFGLKLSPTLLWTYGTAGALASVLCEQLLDIATETERVQ
ncbi:SDR family NAD(P)-dependent oxidoreductase [Micromonospora sp. NBC_01638]|uniref:type I polyketide synthase n=1 Tax=Micromonospora sp. NBC_01638 TaxID=2975982 RepID=UPI00386DDA06|nr:type I polyketide synthase [Micromonospora sp. NBC_01638]